MEPKETSSLVDSTVVLANRSGSKVVLSTCRASIIKVRVPDGSGQLSNVVADSIGASLCIAPLTERGNASWNLEKVGDNSASFALRAANGDGSVIATVEYIWRADDTLEIYLSAAPAVAGNVAFMWRASFNLDGSGAPACQTLWINADRPGSNNIKDWEDGVMQEAAVIASKKSKRQLSIFTTLPCIRAKSDNGHGDVAISRSQTEVSDSAIALECYGLPDMSRVREQLIFLEFTGL